MKIFKSLTEIKEYVTSLKQEFYASYKEENIKHEIEKILQKGFNEMLASAIGFRYSFGKWEISSNMNTSALQRDIVNCATAFIKQFREENIIEFKLTYQMKQSLKKAYTDAVKNGLRRAVEQKAKDDLNDFINNLSLEDSLVNDEDSNQL